MVYTPSKHETLIEPMFQFGVNIKSTTLGQKPRDVVPMLGKCWASVVDGVTALAQHWDNVSCLLLGVLGVAFSLYYDVAE